MVEMMDTVLKGVFNGSNLIGIALTLLCKNSPASLSRGMNCTFSGLVPIFFLCGWSDAITFQMLSDKCHIICRFIICNIERWGKNFNKLIFFPFFFKTRFHNNIF